MEVRNKLLKAAGYTHKKAAAKFFNTKLEDVRGLSADQLLHKGRQNLKQMCVPFQLSEGAEYMIIKGWIFYSLTEHSAAL